MKCNFHSATFLQTLSVFDSDTGLCVHIWRLGFKKLWLQPPAVWDGRLIAAFWISSLSVTLYISPYLSSPQSPLSLSKTALDQKRLTLRYFQSISLLLNDSALMRLPGCQVWDRLALPPPLSRLHNTALSPACQPAMLSSRRDLLPTERTCICS